MIVSSSKDDAAEDLSRELAQRGHKRVVLLSDQPDEAATRRRDEHAGVFHIARVFTAFDIRWVEEQA